MPDATQGALAAALVELARRLKVELDLPTAEVWDGPWHAMQDPGRLSVKMPAALVSLNALEISNRARRRFHPGQLRGVAGGNPANEFPAPGQGGVNPTFSPALEAHARIDVGVTMLASDPKSSARSARVAELAEGAIPVLVGFALEDVRGTNLYTKALYTKGLAAFLLVGRRDIELVTPGPERTPPEQVEAIDNGCPPERETLYVRGVA